MQVANMILAAYKLGKATKWMQLYPDGTSRRQTSFQNLIIDVEYEDGSTESIIVSSGIFSENETAGGSDGDDYGTCELSLLPTGI